MAMGYFCLTHFPNRLIFFPLFIKVIVLTRFSSICSFCSLASTVSFWLSSLLTGHKTRDIFSSLVRKEGRLRLGCAACWSKETTGRDQEEEGQCKYLLSSIGVRVPSEFNTNQTGVRSKHVSASSSAFNHRLQENSDLSERGKNKQWSGVTHLHFKYTLNWLFLN